MTCGKMDGGHELTARRGKSHRAVTKGGEQPFAALAKVMHESIRSGRSDGQETE